MNLSGISSGGYTYTASASSLALTVKAITAVMAELPAIPKGDKGPEGYAYRGIEAITAKLQPLMAKHGVITVPVAEEWSVVPTPAGKDGWTDVRLTVTWHIFGPGGAHITARTAGIGRDRSDKGVNKAHTQAYKYLLLGLFCISDKADDTDGYSPEAAPEGLEYDDLRSRLGKELAKLDKGTLDVIRAAMQLNIGATKLADVPNDRLIEVFGLALETTTKTGDSE